MLVVLLAAVAFVLLIVCVNVATLMIALVEANARICDSSGAWRLALSIGASGADRECAHLFDRSGDSSVRVKIRPRVVARVAASRGSSAK